MDWPQKCAAVIPCFNEAANIGALVAGVKRFLPTVIVVDDDSTDGTARIAAKAGAEVVSLGKNSGKGAALRAGWNCARTGNFEWVLMLDGDGQHSPEDVPILLNCAETTAAKLVIGRRNFEKIPWLRRLVNRFLSRQISRLAGADVPDSQCGFRLAELELLGDLPLYANHFEIESEMLVAFYSHSASRRAGRRGRAALDEYPSPPEAGDAVRGTKSHPCHQGKVPLHRKLAFVPIQTIYKNSPSRIRPFMDTVRWLRWRMKARAVFATISPCPPQSKPMVFARALEENL